MEIKSFKKLNDNRYKIKLITDEEIILYDDLILKYNLLITKKIDSKELTKINKENLELECFYKAIKYLTGKSRCKKEIINYLKRFSYSAESINKTLKKLEEKNYLNEEKYLISFINDQINLTNNGPAKIKRKLLNLGLEEEKIIIKLDEIKDEVWYNKLEKIISKKILSNKKDGERKIKEKILFTCVNEGFKKEDILNILEKKELPNNLNSLEKEANKLYIKLKKKYADNEIFVQLKVKLLNKGFEYSDIDNIINNLKKLN